MKGLTNYYSANKNNNYIRVNDIAQHNLTLEELLPKTRLFTTINEIIGVSVDDVIEYINNFKIPLSSLFEYSTHNGLSLIEENGVYIIKRIKEQPTRFYYDVYICENYYSMVEFSPIMEYFMNKMYPNIFQDMDFNTIVERPGDLPTYNTKIKHLDYSLGEFTLQELYNLLNGNEIKESKFSFYDSFIALDLEQVQYHGVNYDYSLVIPYQAIINKDWSLIEDFVVHSIIKRNPTKLLGEDKNNWFEGKQKDAPYWDNELVKKLKSIIIN